MCSIFSWSWLNSTRYSRTYHSDCCNCMNRSKYNYEKTLKYAYKYNRVNQRSDSNRMSVTLRMICLHLYLVSKWQKFLMSMFLINLFLAFFIGYIAWQFIGADIAFRDWLLAISWFTSFPLLSILEKQWSVLIEKYLWINKK